MANLLWVFVLAGYAVAGVLSTVWIRRIAARIGLNSTTPHFIGRAAAAAGMVAALPALFFATIIGGNLGAVVAAHFSAGLALGPGSEQAVIGAGVALGVAAIACVIVVSTATAAAVFMKVYLAKSNNA